MTPDKEKLDEALNYLRALFVEMFPDYVEKRKAYKKTGSFSHTTTLSGAVKRGKIEGFFSLHLTHFLDLLEKGFFYDNLRDTFEILLHMYCYTHNVERSMVVKDYIDFDTFDKEKYEKDLETFVKTEISLNVLEKHIPTLLKKMGIKDLSFLKTLNNEDHRNDVFQFLDVIKKAKEQASGIAFKGDRTFLISKIPVNGKPFKFTKEVHLKNNLIYSKNPSDIVAFANQAPPGIYVLLNIPEKALVDTAFYFVFANNSDAILIENNKHSFREQIYRTKSDGTDGEAAWLARKTEDIYLPFLDEVFAVLNRETDIKSLIEIDPKDPFKSLKKLTDCDLYELAWTHAFVDGCLKAFRDTDILERCSNSLSLDFVKIEEEKLEHKNLPALYKSNIPTADSLNITWDEERLEVDEVRYCAPSIQKAVTKISESITAVDILKDKPSFGLTSQEHIEAALTYKKRAKVANTIQEQLDADILENHETVIQYVKGVVRERWSTEDLIKRALEDNRYSMRLYNTFHQPVEEGEALVKHTVLQGKIDALKYAPISRPDPEEKQYFVNISTSYSDLWVIPLVESDRYVMKRPCPLCHKYNQKKFYSLLFADWLQFKEFFKLSEKETTEAPLQLKEYLNQSGTLYYGNIILDDLDPMTNVKNPWWRVRSLEKGTVLTWGSEYTDAFLRVSFGLCGICNRKLTKKVNKK